MILASPAARLPRAYMVELVEGQTVVCDLTQERTYGRRVGWCYLDGQDIAEALVRAGLARDCPRFSGGQYAPRGHLIGRQRAGLDPPAGRVGRQVPLCEVKIDTKSRRRLTNK